MITLATTNDLYERPFVSIPETWKISKLQDIAQIIMGQSPPSDTYNAEGIGLPFLQGKAEFQNTFPKPIKWCSLPQRSAIKGSILISIRAPVGDVNIAQHDYCIGRGLAALNGKEYLDNWYLFYQLIYSKERLEERGSGSIFKSINKNTLLEFPIPLPPLPEQRAIAHVLSTVRQAIEATERVIDAARQLKKSMVKQLILDMKDDWTSRKLPEVVDIRSGGTPSTKVPDYWNGDIEWVSAEDVSLSNGPFIQKTKRKISALGLEKCASKILPSYTIILIARGATMGRVKVLFRPMAMNQTCYGLMVKQDCDPLFIYYLLESMMGEFQRLAYGAIFSTVTTATLREMKLPVPDYYMQKEISCQLLVVDNKILAELKYKQTLEVLFESLLHHLMTGKIRVGKEI